MENVPIGKRTRLQKSLNNENFLNNSGFSSSDDDDEDENECFVIDETEFLKSISRNSEKNSAKTDVGIEKNISSNLGRVYENHGEISKGLDDKAESIMNDDENDGVHVDDDDDDEKEEEDEDENVYILVDDDDGNDGVHVDDNGNARVLADDDDGNDGVRVDDDDDGVVDDGNGGVSVVENDGDDGSYGVGVDDGGNDSARVDDDGDGNDGARVDHDGNGVFLEDANDGVGVEDGNDGVSVVDHNRKEDVSGGGVDDDDVNDGVGDDDDGNDGVGNRVGVGFDDDGNDGVDIDDDYDGNDGVRVDDDEEVPIVKLPRRVFEGMVLPTYIEKDVEGNDFVGKRTRSHYKFRNKFNHHGTPNSPISIDIEEESSLSHDEEDHEPNSREYGEGKRKRGRPPLKRDDKVGLNLDVDESSSSEDEEQHFEFNRRVKSPEDGGGKRKRGRPPLKKVNKEDLELMKPRGKRLKTKAVQNVLLNAILENGKNAGLKNIASSVSESFLPLKFRYGVEKLVPEISEEEQEVKSLFTNMDFALGVCDIGFEPSCLDTDNDEDDKDNAVLCDSAILQEKLCLEGKHYWIYDELIGIKCKFCLFVKLEIQYVTPDFNKNPFGRTKDARYYGQYPYNDTKVSDRFQFPDLSYDIRGDPSIPNDHISGTVWDLIPGVARTLYPHQRDGFEFIWKNIAGGIRIDELAKPTEAGSGGCIICHAPGTGKTRLAIVFLQSFLRQYPKSRPVIIAPYSMLRTWEEEFDRWNVDIPFFNLNEKELSGKEDLPLLKGQNVKNSMKDEYSIRMAKLLTWSMGKGVLAISYGLFQRLAGDGKCVDEKVRQVFLEQPDLLVLDEGHTARNDKSSIVKVLSKVVTKRRVILSGTPFQNNFEELHTTIALVREEFGVPSCCHLNDERKIEKLRKQIGPFVHVHEGEILRDTLPGLFELLIVLRPSELQKYIYAHIARFRTPFLKFDNQISLASVHPSILCETDSGYAVDKEQETLLKDRRMDLDAGAKIRFLVELIKLCKGERVLVFGQRLPSLNFIGDLLESLFEWTKGRELLYIDGGQDMKERQSLIKLFNDPGSEARVLLASTKACCEGISLVGASRVVLLDVVWNPSVERQAISRAYRLGQEKDVFIYHLIISGTLEEEKFRRQTTKEHYSKLLFSSSSPSGKETTMHKKSNGSRMVSEDHILEAMTHHEKINYMFEKIINQPKADDDMIKSFAC